MNSLVIEYVVRGELIRLWGIRGLELNRVICDI